MEYFTYRGLFLVCALADFTGVHGGAPVKVNYADHPKVLRYVSSGISVPVFAVSNSYVLLPKMWGYNIGGDNGVVHSGEDMDFDTFMEHKVLRLLDVDEDFFVGELCPPLLDYEPISMSQNHFFDFDFACAHQNDSVLYIIQASDQALYTLETEISTGDECYQLYGAGFNEHSQGCTNCANTVHLTCEDYKYPALMIRGQMEGYPDQITCGDNFFNFTFKKMSFKNQNIKAQVPYVDFP